MERKNRIRIAIDGPAGAGKSTVAKLLAKELGIDYIDTGAMYRAVALKLIRCGVDYQDTDALNAMLAETEIDFDGGHILLDGDIVDGFIRTTEVGALASSSSAKAEIRQKLVMLQRAMGEKKSLVMDGRDIGTNVFTDAEYKFYLTASVEVRARRRLLELQEKGIEANLEEIEKDIATRDYQDSHRALNPLKKADDAIEVDSSYMGIEEVLAAMKSYIKEL